MKRASFWSRSDNLVPSSAASGCDDGEGRRASRLSKSTREPTTMTIHRLLENRALDPEAIAVMVTAFEDGCANSDSVTEQIRQLS